MPNYKDWIIKNNRLTAPLISLILSSLVTLAAVYFFGELMFLVPVVTFFSFHYTKLYRFRLRVMGGTIVFILVAFLATGLLTQAIYNSEPTYHTAFSDGTNVYSQVTPYSGSSSQYTYTLHIIPNGTFDYNSLDLNIHGSNGFNVTVPYKSMTNQTFAGNNTEILTYVFSGISTSGIYSYNLTAQKNGTIYTTEISGPLNTSEFVIFTYLLPTYAIYYLIIFELIYVAGLFIGRSIGNSRSYRQSRKSPEEEQKQQ